MIDSIQGNNDIFTVNVKSVGDVSKNQIAIEKCRLLRLNATRLKSELVHTLTSLYWMRGSNANAAS